MILLKLRLLRLRVLELSRLVLRYLWCRWCLWYLRLKIPGRCRLLSRTWRTRLHLRGNHTPRKCVSLNLRRHLPQLVQLVQRLGVG